MPDRADYATILIVRPGGVPYIPCFGKPGSIDYGPKPTPPEPAAALLPTPDQTADTGRARRDPADAAHDRPGRTSSRALLAASSSERADVPDCRGGRRSAA